MHAPRHATLPRPDSEGVRAKHGTAMNDSKTALVISTLALALAVLIALGILPSINVFGSPTRTDTLILEDVSGQARMMLTTRPHGAPTLSFLDSAGAVRMELSLTPTESPGMSLLSPDGKSRLTASLRGPGNQPEVSLYDGDGVRKWRVGLTQDGEPAILEEDVSE